MPERVWLNGEAVGSLPAALRATHYGDGVFRTCLAWGGRIVDLERQIGHLQGDAARLSLQAPDASLLARELSAAAAGTEPAVVKLVLSRRAGGRGYRAASDAADRLIFRDPAPRYPAEFWTQGVRADFGSLPLATQASLAGVKHLNRLEQVLASRELTDDLEELILSDLDGRPVCGTRTNLFVLHEGRLLTASLNRCGIAGMMRQRCLERAADLGIETQELDLRRDWLLAAQELFVCNSLIGIWPLRRLGDRDWAAPGPLTARLSQALAHPRLC